MAAIGNIDPWAGRSPQYYQDIYAKYGDDQYRPMGALPSSSLDKAPSDPANKPGGPPPGGPPLLGQDRRGPTWRNQTVNQAEQFKIGQQARNNLAAMREAQFQEALTAFNAPRAPGAPASGFNPNMLAGGQFGNVVNPGRQQMADMMGVMSGRPAQPLTSSQFAPFSPGYGGAAPAAGGFMRYLPGSGSFATPTGRTQFGVAGGSTGYSPSTQFSPGTTVATANSGPTNWGFQSNPLQAFTNTSGFGQPQGGYQMGGMPKDNSTAKQWYQQNPSKEWWQSA